MLKIDIQQISTQGDTFFSSADTAYIIFMLIGIVGYFTVPSVANYIIHAGGSNTLLYKVSNLATMSSRSVVNTAAQSTASMVKDAYGDTKSVMSQGYAGQMGDYFKDKVKGNS